MSTILILHTADQSIPSINSFAPYNADTSFHIGYKNYSVYDFVYTDNKQNGVFPESFANKRDYLRYIKKHQKELTQDFYRLNVEFLQELAGKMPKEFYFYLGTADDLTSFKNAEKIKISFTTLSAQTLLQEKTIYQVQKSNG